MDGVLSRLISSVKISKVEVQVQDVPVARTFESKERHTSVTPEDLSERWSMGLGQARETMKRTTQRIVRLAVMPLARRYRAERIFEKRRLRGKWFTDTLDGRVASKDGDRYGQVFANCGYFATVYPMDTKRKAGDALRTFCQEFEDWAEFMEFDEDFQDEFSNIVSNDDIKEADNEFTPEVFDDTYLNMELALPSGDGV